jgi:acyl-CoA dehydrogenase
MPIYKAPVDDVVFILSNVLKIHQYNNIPKFGEATPDTVEAILSEGARLTENIWTPLNQSGDHEGCTRHNDGSVTTPKGFDQAYRSYVEGGWVGLSMPEDYGGQNLPSVLNSAMNEFCSSSNLSLSLYPFLTQGAAAAILVNGSEEQKKLYIPPMLEGRWSGTMNLTEPHCGTDLGLLKTKAVRNTDGSFSLTGQKIFISAGEHDLTDNIIHLVIARIEGAPSGTKGISMFIVPKFIVGEDGSLQERNKLSCGSIEHKMGIHGNSTCVMNYDGATGLLMGEENKGLAAMFIMMNEARLAVGIQGLAQSEVAYQNAASYAKERLQGRALSGAKKPEKPADPIIVHPDVRRNLMMMRAFNEAARALVLWTALQSDIAHHSPDDKERQKASDYMGLMTPVIKGVLTDMGFDNTVRAQQMLGGHGYIEEWGMSQFVRDARIAMIYEGANGIQAMDLVGRKLGKDGGRAIMTFFAEVAGFCKENRADERMIPYLTPLETSLSHLQQATMWFMNNAMAKPDHAGAGAHDFMHLLGLVAMGYMSSQTAKAALEEPSAKNRTRLVTAKFYMECFMPETYAHLARITAGADSVMALEEEMF